MKVIDDFDEKNGDDDNNSYDGNGLDDGLDDLEDFVLGGEEDKDDEDDDWEGEETEEVFDDTEQQ